MIRRRGNVEIRVYYESVRPSRSRSHLKPSDNQEFPGHHASPGNREFRVLPENPGSLAHPGTHDPRGCPGSLDPHAPHGNPARLAGLHNPVHYAPLASPDPSSLRESAYVLPRVGIHNAPASDTRAPKRAHLQHCTGRSPEPPGSGLYPLDAQALAHLPTLPADHRAFFRTVIEVSRLCALNTHDPPPTLAGARVGQEAQLVHTQWLRANRESSPLWPWRTAAMNFIAAAAPCVQTHRHMHDLLMACAFWCCLAHASTCSYAGLYSAHCQHLFHAFGCGTPVLTTSRGQGGRCN
ncbi:virion protein US10 [Chimpanzee herpesvirus strain 105640]|uniref:Virion protein US10 n=1 Tax=Chimpanzee herpesvirus strain 105640 TaxID=332937 RepID=K9MHX2_9ALPH|nr:virion protein US10 [Chimpanzee herpesvirus strain 105640]AFV26960.1 virion protein US10 [Chimpanzee herpesvirus strain 105640]